MKPVSYIVSFWVAMVLLLCSNKVSAQQYSYIYIQGDKNIPFYVKLEGEMMPRYGKNYCIIPRLEPGEINIDILFQQNAFPEEHFILKVPENGTRSFLLAKKDDAYALYDLQQGLYLAAGNKATDDFIADPVVGAAATPVNNATAVAGNNGRAVTDKPVASNNTITEPVATESKRPENKTGSIFKPAQPQAKPATGGEPQFLDDIELNHNQDKGADITTVKKDERQTVGKTTGALLVTNSDCPEPMTDEAFFSIYKKAKQEGEEESKLGYLLGEMKKCYSRAQVRQLAELLDSDAARFTLLKKAYPHTTDQAMYEELEDLLTSSQWKQYFKDIVKK